jgi:transaldolase/glucose-6-phosphate isomerase
VTLIFSEKQYQDAAQAYITGVERFMAAGGDPSKVASVASFFVSRLDTAIDKKLASLGADPALLGKSAVSIAKTSYQLYKQVFSGGRWSALETAGARVQRPLWASTSTKNPSYPDTLYVDGLIGPDTVNTLPPGTLDAFLDHGKVALTLESKLDQAQAQLDALARLGIDPDTVAQKLQDEGVQAFANSFDALLSSIETKRTVL